MKFAVIGSFNEQHVSEWRLKNGDKFAEACQSIGEDIVRHGHHLIVGSDNPCTADYHAMSGALRGMGSRTPSCAPIIVVHSDDAGRRFEAERSARPDLFTTMNSPGNSFRVTHLFEVLLADVVIVVGGAKSSYPAGVAAVIARKRVVPVGSFGGAGARLLSLLQSSRDQMKYSALNDAELGQLRNAWSENLGRLVSRAARITTPPRVLIIHGRSHDRHALKNFLQNGLKLSEPDILVEQLSTGPTIVEKFERTASKVDGAIALVTPDDVGAFNNTALSIESLEARARQNVWLEYGWFWGRLGRKHVLLLLRDNPSIPSDLEGVEKHHYQANPDECSEQIRSFVYSLSHPYES